MLFIKDNSIYTDKNKANKRISCLRSDDNYKYKFIGIINMLNHGK